MEPSIPFDFDFRQRSPEGDLGRWVESFWYARGTVPYARERIAPTGSTVGIVVLGDPISQIANNGAGVAVVSGSGLLVGPHDRPIINVPSGETFALGLVTTAIGCRAVFGIAPSTIRGMVADLAEHWPPLRELRRELIQANTPEDRLSILEDSIMMAIPEVDPRSARCESAVAMLVDEPVRPVAGIANDLGISHSQLNREFTRTVGLSPRALARLLRLRRLLVDLDVHGSIGWAELAVDFGWFDQAHLIRDFKRHTGVTPTEYVAAQRAFTNSDPTTDTAGFVPEV